MLQTERAVRVTMGGGSWMGVSISDLIFVLPAKHDRRIGIMSALSHLLFGPITLERMHQFHSNFTEGSSIIK